jgi:hypothetical protein
MLFPILVGLGVAAAAVTTAVVAGTVATGIGALSLLGAAGLTLLIITLLDDETVEEISRWLSTNGYKKADNAFFTICRIGNKLHSSITVKSPKAQSYQTTRRTRSESEYPAELRAKLTQLSEGGGLDGDLTDGLNKALLSR